ncbi:MAG: DmsC/YnfH family molybdoenzyme membrane anchor subunit [Dehalobacterium sp.]
MNKIPISLIVFTILSGLSAGTYIFINLIALLLPQGGLITIEKPLTIACLIVMCIGLLASATHLGKPLRMPNALANVKSMIAQEGYWGLIFVLVLFLASFQVFSNNYPWLWLRVIGVAVAVGLLFVTSFVYVRAKGIPAWSNSSTIFSFLFSAALMGSVVCLAFLSSHPQFIALSNLTGTVTIVMILLQAVAAIATEVQISTVPTGIDIPKLTGINMLRWIIGLLCPLFLTYLVMVGVMPTSLYIITLIIVIVGEILSRTVFFLRGVHLKSNSSLW